MPRNDAIAARRPAGPTRPEGRIIASVKGIRMDGQYLT